MHDLAPVFTVVIPLFNTEQYITEALDSVQAQTFGDYEVVVINDCSTDSGPAIVESYMARDPRIRMVTQANRGLAGARNTGIREARGRYIALLDADDLWLPRKLELHFAHLEERVEIGVSFTPSLFIDGDGTRMGLAQTPKLIDIDAPHIFCRNPVGNGSAAVLRRAALDAVGFEVEFADGTRTCWFDESFRQSEDIELWTRMAATTAWKFEGIPEPLTLYRVTSNGLSADTSKQLATWRRFRDKLAGIAPHLIAGAGARAEGYQLRYLARRSAIGGHGPAAVSMVREAIRIYPGMLTEEPRRTFETIALALASCAVPSRLQPIMKRALFTLLRPKTLRPTIAGTSQVTP